MLVGRKLHVIVGVGKERELKSRNIRCVGEGDETNKATQGKKEQKDKKRGMNLFPLENIPLDEHH